MTQYINKDALVAEIKKLVERAKAERVLYPNTILAAKDYLLIEDYNKLLSFINTLEVKDPWRPTDEQLEALEWSLSDYRNVIFEERHDTLVSLYNNLKKLKGE